MNHFPFSHFARVNFRNNKNSFGLKTKDAFFHRMVLGRSGSGKTSLLKRFILSDIRSHRSAVFVDPHGDAGNEIFVALTHSQKNRVIYLDLSNPNLNYGLNLFYHIPENKRSLMTSNILEVFQRNWKSAWGAKMEAILREAILLLTCIPDSSLSDLSLLLVDSSFRAECLPHQKNPDSLRFWKEIFPKFKFQSDLLPTLNKVNAFLSYDIIRKLVVRNSENNLDLRKLMDSGTSIIISGNRGQVGSDTLNIFLSLFLVALSSAGYSRIDTPREKRKPCFWYFDECQSYSGSDLLSENLAQIRKFNIGMCLSFQHLDQLSQELKTSVLANTGSQFCFRLSMHDARIMEKEFYPYFKAIDFINLAVGEIYLRLMIDGRPSKPFSAVTLI